MKIIQNSQKYPIIKLTNEPLVSMDYIGEKFSAIVDTRWIDTINSELIKIVYGMTMNMAIVAMLLINLNIFIL